MNILIGLTFFETISQFTSEGMRYAERGRDPEKQLGKILYSVP